jgi:hypothetical protein
MAWSRSMEEEFSIKHVNRRTRVPYLIKDITIRDKDEGEQGGVSIAL